MSSIRPMASFVPPRSTPTIERAELGWRAIEPLRLPRRPSERGRFGTRYHGVHWSKRRRIPRAGVLTFTGRSLPARRSHRDRRAAGAETTIHAPDRSRGPACNDRREPGSRQAVHQVPRRARATRAHRRPHRAPDRHAAPRAWCDRRSRREGRLPPRPRPAGGRREGAPARTASRQAARRCAARPPRAGRGRSERRRPGRAGEHLPGRRPRPARRPARPRGRAAARARARRRFRWWYLLAIPLALAIAVGVWGYFGYSAFDKAVPAQQPGHRLEDARRPGRHDRRAC